MRSEQVSTSRFPPGDLALLIATAMVGAWPFVAALWGETPPSWELGVGALFVMVSLIAIGSGLARDGEPVISR